MSKMDWDKKAEEIAEERAEAARIKLIVNTLSKFKKRGVDYCRHFAKEYMEATDADTKKAIEIIFGNSSEA